MALTNKNKLFIEEYIANGYKEQAECYHKIYPDASWNTCKTNSSKLLASDAGKQYMREIQHERFERLNITADRIAEELSKMAFGNVDETLKNSDKARALDLLQKQLGLQTQKVQAEVESNVVINITE